MKFSRHKVVYAGFFPMIAKVITDLSLDKVFDYQIPPEIEADIRPGTRVRVPFVNSFRLGFVLELAERSDYSLSSGVSGPMCHFLDFRQYVVMQSAENT